MGAEFWVLNALLLAIVGYVVMKVLSAKRVGRQPKERTFSRELASVRVAALRTVEKMKGKVEHSDDRSIRFRTGLSWKSWTGQTVTVVMSPTGEGGTEVRVTGKANPSFQLYDWHEADFIAQRFLRDLDDHLVEGGARR